MSGTPTPLQSFSKLGHDAEKGNPLVPTTTVDPSGSVIDISTARVDPSGSALVPTPTNDPLDPLNWSKLQKYICIGIVCYFYFLFTYQTTAPIPSFLLATGTIQCLIYGSQLDFRHPFSRPCSGTSILLCLGRYLWKEDCDDRGYDYCACSERVY